MVAEERRPKSSERGRLAVPVDEIPAQLRKGGHIVRLPSCSRQQRIRLNLKPGRPEGRKGCLDRYTPGNVMLPVIPVAMRVGGILVRGVNRGVVHRLPGRRPHSFDEIGGEWSPTRKVQDRMYH